MVWRWELEGLCPNDVLFTALAAVSLRKNWASRPPGGGDIVRGRGYPVPISTPTFESERLREEDAVYLQLF